MVFLLFLDIIIESFLVENKKISDTISFESKRPVVISDLKVFILLKLET